MDYEGNKGVGLLPLVTAQQDGAPHEAIFWRGADGKQWSVLAADGTKHLQDKDRKQPELFDLPNDISEANNILDTQPDRASELHAQWKKWDEDNVPCRCSTRKAALYAAPSTSTSAVWMI